MIFFTNAEVTLSSSQSIDFFLEVIRSNLIIGKFNSSSKTNSVLK